MRCLAVLAKLLAALRFVSSSGGDYNN